MVPYLSDGLTSPSASALTLTQALTLTRYVRSRYGGGKTMKWLRWKCSHTNPVTPILYLPKDVKERMRVELHSSEV